MVLMPTIKRSWPLGLAAIALIASLWSAGSPRDWFTTRDGRTARALARGDFEVAAHEATTAYVRGYALFRGGDFEAAAAAFGRADTAASALGRGNALVMLGRYDQAVGAYQRALELRPGWEDAEVNKRIAEVRGERIEREGGDMTGGKLGADEVVFEEGGRDEAPGETETTDGGAALGDMELRALWLRRMKTSPADFLRARFAWQHARAGEGPK